MLGTPGSSGAGARREQTGTVASPRNGIGVNNGRVTPVRTRNGESTFTTPNMMSGYETPTNKILSHVPSTVTNRSSERRRRIKFEGSESSGLGDKSLALSAGFMDAKSGRVRAPTFDTSAPPMRERSNSNGSTKSENVFTPRALTKPTSKNNNFFHANEEQDTRPSPGDPSEMFFFAANNVRNVPSKTSLNPGRQRRLSNSSQYSSLSNAKEPCDQNVIPTTPNRIYPRSSPTSPSKSNFHNPPGNTRTSPPSGLKNDTPGSPLRPCLMISRSPSPTKEQLSPTPQESSCESKLPSANNSTPPGVSDNSEDDLNTKSLLPTASDLENSARINRKIADLEISNASLLAVNKGLERLTKEQTLEIRSLRKQLRQSLRISTVPRQTPSPVEDSESDDEEFEDGGLDFRVTLDKSVLLVEQMLTEGRKGLEYRVRTSELPSGRVLSAEWKDGLV